MTILLPDVLIIPKRSAAQDHVLRLTDSIGDAAGAQPIAMGWRS